MAGFLYNFIDGLPRRISNDGRPYSEIRREFLRKISKIEGEAFCLLYLAGKPVAETVELILTNSSFEDDENITYPNVRRVRLNKGILRNGVCRDDLLDVLGVLPWLALIEKSNFVVRACVLEGPNYSDTEEDRQVRFKPRIIGLILLFVPKSSRLTPEKLTALKVAERLLIGDIANSRLERSALAANEILSAIREEKSILSNVREVCSIYNRFTQSNCTLAFRLDGDSPEFIGSFGLANSESETRLADLVSATDFFTTAITNLSAQAGTSNAISQSFFETDLHHEVSWLIAPCVIDAIDLSKEASSNEEMAFIVFVMIGKSAPHYLGRTYSETDLGIAKKLCSIISTHIPASLTSLYMKNIADTFLGNREITQEIEEPNHALLILESAQRLAIAIKSVILVEINESAEVEITAEPALSEFAKAAVSEKSFSIPDISMRNANGLHLTLFDEEYLCWDVGTDFRNTRWLLLSTGQRKIPVYLFQVLKTFVENYYLYIRTQDFFSQQTTILAQVRHALRGPLSAAMGILRFMAARQARYKTMPTKFARIMDTPTMRDWIPNALKWTEQAYLLADAPKYLLGRIKFEDIRWSDVDVVDIVRSVIEAMSSEISRRELRIEFPMGEAKRQFVVSADTMLIWTVVFNLIDNAVKYSYAGWRVSIAIERVIEKDTWKFSVTNFGVPIHVDERKRIFQPWTRSRIKEVGRRRPGTGLGLAVCKQILLAHDENAIFDVHSEVISESPTRMAQSEFFFELAIKGKAQYASAESENISR